MMKKILILMVLLSMVLLSNAQKYKITRIEYNDNTATLITTPKTNVKTVLINTNDNLPIVGGVISGDVSNVKAKLIIVTSQNPNPLLEIVAPTTPLTNPYEYNCGNDKDHEHTNVPRVYRVIDCSNVNKEQFFCELKALLPNTKYYVRTVVIDNNSVISYGNVETVYTPNNFKRMMIDDLRKEVKPMYINSYLGKSYSQYVRMDFANVWNSRFEHTTFDLVTDEIIDVYDGFVYSSNESPTPNHKKLTNYDITNGYFNSCYKFATEWNYILWLTHSDRLVYEGLITDEPIITQNGEYVTIESKYDVYYEVNQEGRTRPENFTKHYEKPFKTKKGDVIKAYAINKETNFPSYTNIFVMQ